MLPMTALGAESLQIRHLPLGEAVAGEPLAVTAEVTNPHRLALFALHFRHQGEHWQTAEFRKDENGEWAAIISAKDVKPPALEYYLSAQEQGGKEVDRFASEESPHPVLVRLPLDDAKHAERLLRHEGHTSTATAFGEMVNFGSHPGLRDGYYQAEASYGYRILALVEHIRIGMGLISGEVPPPGAFQAGYSGGGETRNAGLKYGFGELAFNFANNLGATGKLILGADKLGFCTGAAGMLRIGEETAAHAEIGAQVIQRYGYDASLRFAWDTVPRWPMGFGVHITNMPKGAVLNDATPDNPRMDQGAPTGIRAIYDVGFRATDQVTLLGKVGYQARYSLGGGATVGGGLSVEW
jgi:hypothetical protein